MLSSTEPKSASADAASTVAVAAAVEVSATLASLVAVRSAMSCASSADIAFRALALNMPDNGPDTVGVLPCESIAENTQTKTHNTKYETFVFGAAKLIK